MGIHKLLLYPAKPDLPSPDPDRIRDALAAIGLLSGEFTHGGQRQFFSGEEFLDLITFLGCSPNIELDPPDPDRPASEQIEAFCYLQLVDYGSEIRAFAGRNATTPRCRACRRPVDDWRMLLARWRDEPAQHRHRCPNCGAAAELWELNWRQSAAFGRFFLQVCGVHPAEAVPGERLLGTLEEVSGTRWRYAYYQE